MKYSIARCLVMASIAFPIMASTKPYYPLTSLSISEDDTQANNTNGISFYNLPYLKTEQIEKSLTPYLLQPITGNNLENIRNTVTYYLQQQGFYYHNVWLPEQKINDGQVHLAIVPALMGELKINGRQYFKTKTVNKQLGLQQGTILNKNQLDKKLWKLNRNPFRYYQYELANSTKSDSNELDLILKAKDRRPFAFNIGFNNTGSDSTDEYRQKLGIKWGNIFGLGHVLNYQGSASPGLDRLKTHYLSYTIPLNNYNEFMTSYSTSDTQAAVPNDYNHQSLGDSFSIQYSKYYNTKAGKQLKMNWGLQIKDSNTEIDFQNNRITDRKSRVSQFFWSIDKSYRTKKGFGNITAKLVISPGDIGSNNNDETFNQRRSQATADYSYINLRANHHQKFNKLLSWHSELDIQLTNDRLIGSEQISLGGFYAARGYDNSALFADNGLLLRNSLRLSQFKLFKRARFNTFVSPFLFVDGAIGEFNNRLDPENEQTSLLSFGLGTRINISKRLTVNASYGWPQKDFDDTSASSNGHISASFQF